MLLNWLGDIVAHTSGYERFARPLGLLDGDPPNVMRYLFTDAPARGIPGLGAVRRRAGRPSAPRGPAAPPPCRRPGRGVDGHPGSPVHPAAEGRTSHAAAQRHWILPRPPEAGRLRLSYETLALPDDGQRLMVHLPADEATATALDHLNGLKPGALRAVSG